MNDAAPPPPEADARAAALARLGASRERLREALLPMHANAAGAHRHGRARLWRHVLHRWWRRQPLAAALRVGGTELRDAIVPIVRRHPLAGLAVAAALGAALMLSRHALWRVVAGQVRPLSGSVGAWMLQQLSSPAVQAAALAWVAQQARAPAPTSAPAAASDPAAAAVDTPPATATDDLR